MRIVKPVYLLFGSFLKSKMDWCYADTSSLKSKINVNIWGQLLPQLTRG